jgi:hypothetical protein
MARLAPTLVAAISLAVAISASAQAAPPANDNFASPNTTLSGSFDSAFTSNAEATKESGEPNHAGNAGGASVWFTWTAPDADPVTIDTCGSNFDTLLAVYTGSAVGSLTPVANDDDRCAPGSEVSFTPAGGTTYRIAVDGFNDPVTAASDPATGSIALYVDAPTPPPPPPPCPPPEAPPGPVYRGTHGAGGPICFTVSSGYTGVTSLLVENVPGNTCTFGWQRTLYNTPLSITNRSFNDSDGSFSGSFPTERGAEGTMRVSASGCSSGNISWNATTDATPPFTVASPPGGGNPNPNPNPNPSPTPNPNPTASGGGGTVTTVHAPVRHRWSWNRRYTTIEQLQVTVPPGATLRVRCRGGGCPRIPGSFLGRAGEAKARTARTYDLARSVFRNRRLRPGARIELRIVQPGAVGKFFRFKIRRNKIPKVLNRCIEAGGNRVIPCPQ